MPGVEVALIDEDGEILSGGEGEIIVKGPNVFLEYWQRPSETSESFMEGGWFRNGRRRREGTRKAFTGYSGGSP
ncbi:MAG: AMP-binding protein [Thermodesulfobacteriota bacterium]